MKKSGTSVKRFDFGEMRSVEKTPQGFLKIPGFATRVGVFPYLTGSGEIRRELRHPDDVFDPQSMKTLQYAPVTIEHPPVMLTPANVGRYSVGHTTERVEVNRDLLDTDLIVEEQEGIDAVEKEGIRELSSGYLCDVVEEEGVYTGAPYNYRQKNIKYNHLAMVKRGRAGPEVRMRLDSADAVMRSDEDSIPNRSEFAQEAATDSEGPSTKKLVILGKEIELPADEADTMQDLLDRYDEMRAKLSELEENMAKRQDKADVDINQKGISPQVKVEQGGPDGRSSGAKTGPKPGSMTGGGSQKTDDEEEEGKKEDGDEHGVIGGVTKGGKADEDMGDEEEEGKNPFAKKDFEGGNAAEGGGAAMSPVDQLKKDFAEMKDKYDAAMGKLDAMASASMGAGEAKPDRMDSTEKRIRARVKLERQAEKLVPYELAKKFDSMTDDQIRATVIKHRHSKADLEGKSSVYLQSRFDSILESNEEEGSESRKNAGRAMLGLVDENGNRMDSAEVDPTSARQKMISSTRALWQSDLSAKRK